MLSVRTRINMKYNYPKQQKMDFLILTNNEFFRLVNDGADGHTITASVYNEFIKEVCAVCCAPPSERHHLVFTLAYIETELDSLHETYTAESSCASHIRKALSFVRRMLQYVRTQVPPLSTPQTDSQPTSSFRWTGSLVELVEIIYAFDEIGCINDGQNDIKDLAAFFGSLFGMEIKVRNCYDAYLDMKRRKNESRTYFLDKLRERLNLRMQRDDAREMTRR